MSCRDIRELLPDYATRELSPENRRLVDEHVLTCDDCRRELALASAIVSSLETQPVRTPSAGFSTKLMASLPQQRRMPSPWWWLSLIPVLGGSAWLFRKPLLGDLLHLLEETGIQRVQLPQVSDLTMAQFGIGAAVVVGFGLLLLAGGLYAGWKYLSEN